MNKGYRITMTPCEDPEKGFTVTSKEPDLQGLVTQGEDEEEALKMAYEAAELLLEDKGLTRDRFFLYMRKSGARHESQE
jgi:predicted RNase H-like HicB family nuclease